MSEAHLQLAKLRMARFAPALAALVVSALCLVWLMAAVAFAAPDQSWRLHIRSVAVVDQPRVLLGDIAMPTGDLADGAWREMAAMPLWSAPVEKGRPFVISRTRLDKLLEEYMGDMALMCVVGGQLVIQSGGRLAERFELERGVAGALGGPMAALDGELSLRDYHLPDYILLSTARNKLVYDVADSVDPGRVSLTIREVSESGGTLRKYTASAFLDQWVTVACASRPIGIRETLSPENVTFKRQNAAYMRGPAWDGKRFGLRAMRSIGEGEVIYEENLDELPMVSKGDIVNLVFEGRFVRLSVEAQAMSDGRGGEMIIVRNLQSRREVSALVVDGRTVMTR